MDSGKGVALLDGRCGKGVAPSDGPLRGEGVNGLATSQYIIIRLLFLCALRGTCEACTKGAVGVNRPHGSTESENSLLATHWSEFTTSS